MNTSNTPIALVTGGSRGLGKNAALHIARHGSDDGNHRSAVRRAGQHPVQGRVFPDAKLLPLMTDGGRIVNISTGLARFALPGYAAYASMKGAIEVLTKYMAKELGPRGIAVNVVAPGAIETDFGGVIASLLSSDNRWINVQRIEASGGMFL